MASMRVLNVDFSILSRQGDAHAIKPPKKQPVNAALRGVNPAVAHMDAHSLQFNGLPRLGQTPRVRESAPPVLVASVHPGLLSQDPAHDSVLGLFTRPDVTSPLPVNVEVGAAFVAHMLGAQPPKFKPVREAVSELFSRDQRLGRLLGHSGNTVMELPSRVEKQLLKVYGGEAIFGHLFSNRSFPDRVSAADLGLLQQRDSLRTAKTLALPGDVTEALGKVYESMTSTLPGQQEVLAHVFNPDQPQASRLTVGDPKAVDLVGDVLARSRSIAMLMLNGANAVPQIDATLRELAGNGQVDVRFDFEAGADSGADYRLKWEGDRRLAVLFGEKIWPTGRVDAGGEAGMMYVPRQHALDSREYSDRLFRVLGAASAEALSAVRGGGSDPSALVRSMGEALDTLKEQPLVNVVPVVAVLEPETPEGHLRVRLADVMLVAEYLDGVVDAALPRWQPLLRGQIEARIPQLAGLIGSGDARSAPLDAAASLDNVEFRGADMNVDDFLSTVDWLKGYIEGYLSSLDRLE